MKATLGGFAATLLVGSLAICQNLVPIPSHSSIYNGYSRGFNFTANTTFIISQLDLPLDAFLAGDTAGYLVRVNGNQVLLSTGNAGPISTNILVNTGDIVDVIGNWSPAVTGNFTAHNSYGSTAPYATTIEGVPHTLNRTGWQWDIGAPGFAGTYLAPTTGSIGRVLMYTSSPSGFASKTPYGTGCYDRPRMVHEMIPGNTIPIDLVGTQQMLIYTPNGNGGNYVIVPGGPPYDAVTPAASGVDLATMPYSASVSASWDDASIVMTLPVAQFPTGFPFPGVGGGVATDITINSNGKIYLGNTVDATFASTGSNYASLAPFQGTTGAGLPVLAPFNVDLDPVAGGHLWYEAPSPNGGVRITWAGIANWQDTVAGAPPAVVCDIQMELLPSGMVTFAYGPSLGNGGSLNNGAIIGFSAGFGQVAPPQVDWSTLNGYVSGDGSVPLAIDADARPVLGTTINVTVANIPAGAPFAAVLYGLTKLDPGISLAGIGMPGCLQYGSQESMALGIVPGTSFTTPFSIPNNPAFAGVVLVAQGAAFNPPAVPNALGALSSNGLELGLDVN